LNTCILFLLDVGKIRAGLEMARLEPVGAQRMGTATFSCGHAHVRCPALF
jgi:hypothetical protein